LHARVAIAPGDRFPNADAMAMRCGAAARG